MALYTVEGAPTWAPQFVQWARAQGASRGEQTLLLEVQMKKWHQTTRPTQGEDGQVQQQLRPAKEESASPPRGGSLMSSGGQKVT